MNNGYTNTRMDLKEVCNWLTNKGYEELGDIIKDKFTYHTWTVNGMIRTDIVSDIFERVYGNNDMFMALECDVLTHMEFISYGEAHVD
jgi:hypothetical protein